MQQAPVNISERVYQDIRQMVVTGEIAPGERLVQRKLSTRLGVSIIPVIEATRRLQHDGLVVQHPNWGAQVRQWTESDLMGAYQAREALEGISCRLFVQVAGAVEKAQLKEHEERFDQLASQHDAHGWLEADLALHSHIVRSTRSTGLIHIVESSCLITLTLRNAHRRRTAPGREIPEPGVHRELVEALLGADADAAYAAGTAHVRRAYEKLLALSEGQSLV